MGLRVHILKDQYGDTSNGGASSRVGRLTITNVDGPFKPDATAPAAILKHGVMGTIIVVLENPSMDRSRGWPDVRWQFHYHFRQSLQ